MSQTLFKKSKLATTIAMACCSVMLSGCLVDGDTTAGDTTITEGATTITEDAQRLDVSELSTPTATIVGLVQDTNGNPIGGASVSLAGETVTADDNGTYVFEDVAVTGFSEGGTSGSYLSVTIVPPLAEDESVQYVSATVTVNPQAQVLVNMAGEIEDTSDPASTKNSLLSVIIADGLTISAGAAVLPALGASVEGVLRDDETGLIIANAAVSLEFIAGGSDSETDQEQSQNSIDTTYGVDSYMTTTDAEGKFTFTNLPEDSNYDLHVSGYFYGANIENDDDANDDVTTDREGVLVNLGDVKVSAIEIADDINPKINSITGSISTGGTALLKEGLDGTQGIVINFSEPMADSIDAASVFVVDTTEDIVMAVASVVLSVDGLTLTVTTDSAIPAGNEFEIYLAKHDVMDTSDNLLANNSDVSWDDISDSVGSLEMIRLDLQTYIAPVISSSDITITRIDEDGSAADADFDVMRAENAAFVDAQVNGATSLQQLNASDAGDRLEALNNQTVADSALGQTVTDIETDVVRVSFNVTEATTYLLMLEDSDGNDINIDLDDVSDDVNTTINGNELTLTLQSDFDGSNIEVLLNDIDVNSVVTVTPYTDFDTAISSAADSLVLSDNVAATTVLQYSYGEGNTTSGTADPEYGDGGELSGAGDLALGTPILAVTPYLLVPQADNEPVSLDQTTIWDALVAGNEMHANSTDKVDFTSGLLMGFEGYDAAAVAAYTPGSRALGVTFSEDVSVTGVPAFSGSAALSDFTAASDIAVNDQNMGQANGEADLVRFTVDSPLTLANDDGVMLDFTDVIQDSAGNVSTTDYNAKVIIEDKMPTLALTATYNGNSIILTFADEVSIEVGDTLTLDGINADHTITADQVDEDANTGVTTVTIDLDTETNDIDNSLLTRASTSISWTNVFDRGTFDHDEDDDATTEDRHHSIIRYDNVEDENGNKWADYSSATFDLPAIAIRNDVDDFEVTETVTGYAIGTDVITYTIEATHAINLMSTFNGLTSSTISAGAQTLSAADVAEIWTVVGQTIDTSASSTTGAVFTNDGKTLTVTIDLTADMVATDDLGFLAVPSIVSYWDSSAAAIALPDDQVAL